MISKPLKNHAYSNHLYSWIVNCANIKSITKTHEKLWQWFESNSARFDSNHTLYHLLPKTIFLKIQPILFFPLLKLKTQLILSYVINLKTRHVYILDRNFNVCNVNSYNLFIHNLCNYFVIQLLLWCNLNKS